MRAGLDRTTGRVLTGWDHCAQSIAVLLTTLIGARVMRRHFGSDVPALQDETVSPAVVMRCYVAIAAALRAWEPGFRLQSIRLLRGAADGVFRFDLVGIFFPNGHLGDYRTRETRAVALQLRDTGFEVVA